MAEWRSRDMAASSERRLVAPGRDATKRSACGPCPRQLRLDPRRCATKEKGDGGIGAPAILRRCESLRVTPSYSESTPNKALLDEHLRGQGG